MIMYLLIYFDSEKLVTFKVGNKEWFEKEQIGTISSDQFAIYFIRIGNVWH